MPSIDLNADLGEGFGVWQSGDDAGLLQVITSANIACGFHAGDPSIMRRTCDQAVRRGVRIGAQVGYRDLVGFGRRAMDISSSDLSADVLCQLGALDACAKAAGGRVSYLKPHGALYNTAVRDEEQAGAIIAAMMDFDRAMPVLTLARSALARAAAAAGVPVIAEAFADRAYLGDGTLVPRSEPGAVLHDEVTIAERALAMAVDGSVLAADGTKVAIEVQSLCVHGDTPGALGIAQAVRSALTGAGFIIRATAPV